MAPVGLQAFEKTGQGPDIVGMAAASGNAFVQPEILPVHNLRFGEAATFRKQGAERMAGRVHPRPWLGVVEIVVALDGASQGREGRFMAALAKLHFAFEHRVRHAENVECAIAQEDAVCRNCRKASLEGALRGLRFRDPSERCVGNALAIGMHGDAHGDQMRKGRRRLLYQLMPSAEAHLDMSTHCRVAVENRGHERPPPVQKIGRGDIHDPVCGMQRWSMLPGHHCRKHEKVEVMAARGGVEIVGPSGCEIAVVCGHGALALHNRLLVVPALDVNMCGHVMQMTLVVHHVAQQVGRLQRAFGKGRHLHEVDVDVKHSRMRRVDA